MSNIDMKKNVREDVVAVEVAPEVAAVEVVSEEPAETVPEVASEEPAVEAAPEVAVEAEVEVAPEVAVEAEVDTNTTAGSCKPSDWEILPVDDSEDITAYNTATREEFMGSIEEFNKRLRA